MTEEEQERFDAMKRRWRQGRKPHIRIQRATYCPGCDLLLSPQTYAFTVGSTTEFSRSFAEICYVARGYTERVLAS